MNENLITEIIDLNKVKANLLELQKMWEQLIATMAAKSSKDLKFDNLAQNFNTVKAAEAELAKVKQASFEVDKQKVKITAEIIANYDKYGKEEQKIIENEIKRRHEIAETNKRLKEQFTTEQDLVKVLQRETKSIADLDKQNRDLQRIQQKLNLTTKEGLEANEKINAQISKNKETIKQYTNEIDKQRRNIGNYQEAVDTANMSLGEMRRELRELRNMSFAGLSPEEIKQIRDRMAELTDAIGDFQAQINTAAADRIPALMSGLQGLIAVAQGVTGTLAMFGIETEKLDKAMVQLIGVSQALKTAQELQEKGTIKVMLATIKDTAAKTANAVAAKGQAMATEGATMATRALGRVMASNPYLMMAAAVATLVAGMAVLISRLKEAGSVQKEVNEAYKAAAKDIGAQKQELNSLLNVAKDHRRSLKERQEAMNKINELSPEYLGNLTLETINTNSAAAAINLYTQELSKKAKVRALESILQEKYIKLEEQIASGAKIERISKTEDEIAELERRIAKLTETTSVFTNVVAGAQSNFTDLIGTTVFGVPEGTTALNFDGTPIVFKNGKWVAADVPPPRDDTAAKNAYKSYTDAIKKANEEAKLSLALGDDFLEVKKKEAEAIYAATKAYFELNGYTADEIKKLKELRAEIEKLNDEIEKENKAIEEQNKAIEEANKAREEANKAREEEKKRYQDYLDAIKKANEEAKLQIALGEDATEVRKRELEAIYAVTKAYFELNGYTEAEIEKLKELRAEIDKPNVEIEEETVVTISKLKKVFNDFFGTTEPIENWKDTFKDAISQVVNESLKLFNNLIEMQSNQLEQELEAINTLYDKQVSTLDDIYERRKSLLEATIDDEEELAEALARIEEEKTATYNKMQDEKFAKEQEIAKKKAMLEKRKAEMEIAAGSATALVEAIKLIGIATATAAPGDPYSLVARIAAALAAALTVVSAVTAGIAKVKAIQIPEFWAGGEAEEGQLISVAERGRELAVGESGKSYLFDKKSVLVAPERMRIFSNYETNKILEKQTINNVYEKQSNVNLTVTIDNERIKKYFKLN